MHFAPNAVTSAQFAPHCLRLHFSIMSAVNCKRACYCYSVYKRVRHAHLRENFTVILFAKGTQSTESLEQVYQSLLL